MRISDWSSDVCSSDLIGGDADGLCAELVADFRCNLFGRRAVAASDQQAGSFARHAPRYSMDQALRAAGDNADLAFKQRSEEHTSKLQSLMRISNAVSCLQKQFYSEISSRITVKETES